MFNKIVIKSWAILLSLALLLSSTMSYATTAPTTVGAAVDTNKITATPIAHTEQGAEQILDELMSISTKLLSEEFEEMHPGMKFIKNVNISKSPNATNTAFGRFSGGLARSKTTDAQILNFDTGIVLTTGFIDTVNKDTNTEHRATGEHDITDTDRRNDPDLAKLIGVGEHLICDTTFIEFDVFCPEETSDLMFEYALASEEYNTYLTYNDVFGVFINGTNISTIPGTNKAISISNINYVDNKQFYLNNKQDKTVKNDNYGTDDNYLDLPSEFDGFTSTFTAAGKMIPNQYNHIKIAIADNKDRVLDSALFLKSGTLELKAPHYGNFNLMDWSEDDTITIGRSEGLNGTVSVDLEVTDQSGKAYTLLDKTNKPTQKLTVVFNSGDSQAVVKLPKASNTAMINSKLPKTAMISNPQMGAKLGSVTRLDKNYEKALVTLGKWTDDDPDADDLVQIHRSVNFNHTVAVDLEITSKWGVKTYKTVTFDPNETLKTVEVPDISKSIKLVNGKATNIGNPNSGEKNVKNYGVINIESLEEDNTVKLVRNKGSEGTVSVLLSGTTLSGNSFNVGKSTENPIFKYKVEFQPGETEKIVKLIKNEANALIDGTALAKVKIDTPRGGATIRKNERSKQYAIPLTQLGTWNDSSKNTDDVIELKRSGSILYAAEVTMKLTSKTGAISTKVVRFEPNDATAQVTVPEMTKTVLLSNGRGTTISKPATLKKLFENEPTRANRITFVVEKNSEVRIQVTTANSSIKPKFNYKITRLNDGKTKTFSFYGDGRNKPNGMDDLYYMEPGTYMVEIYWLDKRQAETPAQIANEEYNTLFQYSKKELGDNVDKKKFYKKIN